MLQMFHSHVSHVSWSCCIVLTNLVSLSEWHMLHLSVAHFTFHKVQHTWNIQHVAMFRNYVSCAISSRRDAWCSCSWNAVQKWRLNTRGVTYVTLESDLGGPLTSPRWRFYGLGSRLGSNEKGLEVPVHFWAGSGKAIGAHLCFSPLALLDVRWPQALRGPAFEPRSVAAHIEWDDYHFVTRHEALWCGNHMCNAWMYGMIEWMNVWMIIV